MSQFGASDSGGMADWRSLVAALALGPESHKHPDFCEVFDFCNGRAQFTCSAPPLLRSLMRSTCGGGMIRGHTSNQPEAVKTIEYECLGATLPGENGGDRVRMPLCRQLGKALAYLSPPGSRAGNCARRSLNSLRERSGSRARSSRNRLRPLKPLFSAEPSSWMARFAYDSDVCLRSFGDNLASFSASEAHCDRRQATS